MQLTYRGVQYQSDLAPCQTTKIHSPNTLVLRFLGRAYEVTRHGPAQRASFKGYSGSLQFLGVRYSYAAL